ncbi:hypothetical protein GII36_04910 [Candidatus Mycosynbacter amalyticus]|uniref:HIT domain-containing protein n=1 Tax=Candidatus Mycosynbacter amalyticus TaxID=2665156 RepID=A0A857MQ12_9BACT|nr:hypothetical protein [Candidatus Mycosynbacter amalyticus]QHN43161.1 hypothetical protein GII36_04910 [Candidatus Mycosynbacter amalyticus]
MATRCSICDIITSPTNDDVVLLKTHGWRVILMENQGVLGAMYITTERHYQTLGDLSDRQWLGLRDLVRELEGAVSRAFHPVYFNFACDMNDAARDGEPAHVHFKLRPRYAHAVQFEGEVFEDQGFGSKKIVPHQVEKPTLRAIRKVIVSKLGLQIERDVS